MKYKNISPAELQQWLANDAAELIDVREPAEFAGQRLHGATLLPLGSIAVEHLPKTDKAIVIYCQKGARGNTACSKLTADGAVNIYNLDGGIASWQAAGLPVEQGQTSGMPLDRQVQIAIGTLVLGGSLASLFLASAFAWIPVVFGAGLLLSGITASSPLTVLIAKMPWNQKKP